MQERLKTLAKQEGKTVSKILFTLIDGYLKDTQTVNDKIAIIEKRLTDLENQVKKLKK